MNKHRKNWILSLLSVLFIVACNSSSFGQPKEWTVTWSDNSNNEAEFIFYQLDESVTPAVWVEKARFPAESTSGIAVLDATKGLTVGLSAINPAGESGKAQAVIDSKYVIVPAMPGIINILPSGS